MSRVGSPAHSRRGSGPSGRGGRGGGAAGVSSAVGGATPTLSTRLPPAGATSSTSGSPRVQSPAPQAQNNAATGPKDVSRLIGSKVRLTVTAAGQAGEKTVEGNVWCYDSITGVVVLETPAGGPNAGAGAATGKGKMDYRLVKVNQIRSLSVLSIPSAAPPSASSGSSADKIEALLEPLRPVNLAAVAAREAKAVRAEDTRRARTGVGVSRWAQEIFDALGKTLPVRWHQTSIIILDEVILSGPHYRPEDAKAPPASQGRLDRVRQVLDGERKRLLRTEEGRKWEAESDAAAAAPVAAPSAAAAA